MPFIFDDILMAALLGGGVSAGVGAATGQKGKDLLKSSLIGAGTGGLGGAAIGALGSAASPAASAGESAVFSPMLGGGLPATTGGGVGSTASATAGAVPAAAASPFGKIGGFGKDMFKGYFGMVDPTNMSTGDMAGLGVNAYSQFRGKPAPDTSGGMTVSMLQRRQQPQPVTTVQKLGTASGPTASTPVSSPLTDKWKSIMASMGMVGAANGAMGMMR